MASVRGVSNPIFSGILVAAFFTSAVGCSSSVASDGVGGAGGDGSGGQGAGAGDNGSGGADTPAQVPPPSISPPLETITTETQVTLSGAVAGAVIHYTTDGSDPSATAGNVYTGPFNLPEGNQTIKAIASADGLVDSPISAHDYKVVAPIRIRLEAESASLSGVTVANDIAGYSGTGFASGFDADSDRVDFNVSVPEAGIYKLVARGLVRREMGGPKTNDIYVNGAKVGDFTLQNDSTWTEAFGEGVRLDAGANTVAVTKSWGYFELDYIEVSTPEPAAPAPVVSATPVNPNATDNARRLLKYLADQFGKKILSGQMDLSWSDSVSMVGRVFNDTGRYPALQGFDFMNFQSSGGDGLHQVDEAIDWWNEGGVVAFCWHWRDPLNPSGEFYTDRTSYRIPYNTTTGAWESGPAYDRLLADIDAVAGQLQRLQDAGVPVLWRPVHEASGGWFWWGASGPEPYKALYKLIYDRITNQHGIDNLIWVWNGQSADWYPGDDVVDIIGEDVYGGARNYGSQLERFEGGMSSSDNVYKITALTENGSMPDPDGLIADGAWWSWFMTWNDGTAGEGTDDPGNFWTGQYYNDDAHKDHVYLHDYVITRDELPDLKRYPLR